MVNMMIHHCLITLLVLQPLQKEEGSGHTVTDKWSQSSPRIVQHS